jgi:hypothetical protein
MREEKVGNALKLIVGPTVNWLGLFTGLALLLILWGVGIVPAWQGLRLASTTGQSMLDYIFGIAALSGLSLFVAYCILLNLFGSELIIIDSTDLEIQSLIFGFVRSRRSFPNSTVENLRYEEWPGPRGAGMQNGIRFECVGETVTFALNATRAESADIIEQMQKYYKFPISDPPEEESSPAITHW